jgi:predicted helicase
MRERYLEVFDRIWIDNLHGDRKISEYAPDGRTSETVFATQGHSPGIKLGTAVSLLVHSNQKRPTQICYRDWEQARALERRAALLGSLQNEQTPFEPLEPVPEIGLPFKKRPISVGYLDWPLLTELFPDSFPGVQTSRDDVVVDIDRERLIERMDAYFDSAVSDAEITKTIPRAMETTGRFDAVSARARLLKRGIKRGHFLRFLYRPFDARWIYWEPETKLLDEKREDYFAQCWPGNHCIALAQKNRREFDPPVVADALCCRHLIERGANIFPLWLKPVGTLMDAREPI